MTIARTLIVDGDGIALDALLFQETGREDLVALVLDANPGLAALGPILPAGTRIVVPAAPSAEVIATIPRVTLWSE